VSSRGIGASGRSGATVARAGAESFILGWRPF